jgi:hypothetical protein
MGCVRRYDAPLDAEEVARIRSRLVFGQVDDRPPVSQGRVGQVPVLAGVDPRRGPVLDDVGIRHLAWGGGLEQRDVGPELETAAPSPQFSECRKVCVS